LHFSLLQNAIYGMWVAPSPFATREVNVTASQKIGGKIIVEAAILLLGVFLALAYWSRHLFGD
jgi:hypothetical protein